MPDDPPVPPRRRMLTPEQRRFMGTQRMKEEKTEEPAPLSQAEPIAEEENELAVEEGARAERREKITVVKQDVRSSRVAELKTPLLVFFLLFLLAGTFYFGTKFERLKYGLLTRQNAKETAEVVPKEYQAIPVDDLVQQALLAERAGNKQETAEKLLAAKHKDVTYRGILFRVGKIAYDAGDFAGADKVFEQTIALGENIDFANYFRGLIAIRRKDLPAAERFFEAAARADPFTSDYFYNLAESLRLDHKPNESIRQYERARLLSRNEQDATVCQYKIRLALLEAGEAPRVAGEIEQRGADMSVDWLLTAAALDLQHAQADEAVELIKRARAANQAGLFASCTDDFFFAEAAKKNAAVAAALQEPAAANESSQ